VPDRPPFVSFLSDYGHADEFVGVCHGVMLDIAPELRIVDVTHDIPAFDVRAGALALVRAVQYLPDGVVLAVVDPGVGTDRRCVAVEVEGGFLVGPDNGLLAPAAAMLGGARRIVALDNPQYQLTAPGPTFAGRDVMAPAAAYLATGHSLDELGTAIGAAGLAPGLVPLPQEGDDGSIAGEVLWVDRYGNCQLNIAPEQLVERGAAPGGYVGVTIGGRDRRAHWVTAFADAKPSELALVVDSYGMCALALDRRSAAAELDLRAGKTVTVVALSEKSS
jgi:S-adenosyl-L-methionine hydrolase (adenosine-forming)